LVTGCIYATHVSLSNASGWRLVQYLSYALDSKEKDFFSSVKNPDWP